MSKELFTSNPIADALVTWAGWCHVQNIKAELQAALYRGSEEIERLTAERDTLLKLRESSASMHREAMAERDRLAAAMAGEPLQRTRRFLDMESQMLRLRAALERAHIQIENVANAGVLTAALTAFLSVEKQALDENRSGPRNTGDDAGAVTRTSDETKCEHGLTGLCPYCLR